MAAENIFNEDVDYLIKAHDDVMNRDALENQVKELQDREQRMGKAIAQEKKSITDEITSTIKKRKGEIADSYDEQIEANRNKIKQVQAKKSKKKSEQVGKRVKEETADVTEENRQLNIEMKTMFKQKHVPGFCKAGLYYSLFMPKGVGEYFTLLISLLIGLVGLPALVYSIFAYIVYKDKPVNQTLLCAICVAAVIIIVFAIYFLLFNVTKMRFRESLAEGRQIRDKIKANNSKIKAIKNTINKDKDESTYNLTDYDEKINRITEEGEVIAKNKQEALTIFEQDTKLVITQEINSRRMAKLEDMKAKHKAVEEEISNMERQVQAASLNITNQYETFLGKDFCTGDILADVINVMQTGEITTVSEALAVYKGQKSAK